MQMPKHIEDRQECLSHQAGMSQRLLHQEPHSAEKWLQRGPMKWGRILNFGTPRGSARVVVGWLFAALALGGQFFYWPDLPKLGLVGLLIGPICLVAVLLFHFVAITMLGSRVVMDAFETTRRFSIVSALSLAILAAELFCLIHFVAGMGRR
jgi:hypothetical protein